MTSTSHKAQRTQLKTARGSRVCLCGLPAGDTSYLLSNYCNLSSGDNSSRVTVDGPKARECDLAFELEVAFRSNRFDTVDEYLLVEQRVIGS